MLGDHHKNDDDWWFGLAPSADETPADECCPQTYATLPDRWNDGFKLEVRVEPWIRGRTLKIEFPAISVVGPSDVGSIDVTVKQQGELWNARPIVPGWTYPEEEEEAPPLRSRRALGDHDSRGGSVSWRLGAGEEPILLALDERPHDGFGFVARWPRGGGGGGSGGGAKPRRGTLASQDGAASAPPQASC